MTSKHLGAANSGSNSFLALAGLDQATLDALPEAVYVCGEPKSLPCGVGRVS